MNDPKDIVVTISLGKEEKNSSDIQSIEEEESKNKENIALSEEDRFYNLFLHLKENLSKKLYKKTIKEIDVLIENKYIEAFSQAWKISILKIKALLKIVKKKIVKYLINHFEKAKLKHNIYGIKKYLNQIPTEFNKFFENNKDTKVINNIEMIDELLFCYFDYIYLISFFHKKIGNVIESISYLTFIIRLYKETQLLVKSHGTFYKMEKCFILMAQMCIFNEDYFSCLEYLNIVMDICLKNIIFETHDLYEGVFQGDKNKIEPNRNMSSFGLNKNKIENEEENYGDKKLKKVIFNIVLIYFYRGICYDNIGKMKNSIRSYYQCLWFLNHFFVNNFKDYSILIKSILEKSIEFKETIDYLDKKIRYFEHIQMKIKNQNKKNKKDDKNNKYSKNLYSKKFKGLVNKLDKMKIIEIDTVNKFEIKKNIKGINSVKREGRDKNIFLSDIRLLNTYLREDFRVIIDKMNKIKAFDMDYQTRERIQKLIRKIYFDQSQRKLRIKRKNKNLLASTTSFKLYKNRNEDIKNTRYELISNSYNLNNKNRTSSAFSREVKTKLFFPINSCKSVPKDQLIDIKSVNNNNLYSSSYKDFKKGEFFKKSRNNRSNSAYVSRRKYKIYEENKELNNYFNKKYISKRNYIKKLEDRELIFQKSILRLKNAPKAPIPIFNKELIKQNVNETFYNKMSLLISTPPNWRENFSKEEVRNIMAYDKLQNAVIKSLDKTALNKYKEEEKKQKPKKGMTNDGYYWSIKNANNNNNNLIDKLNMGLEEIRQREIVESKNLKKILKETRRNLKNRNESSSCIICGKNRDENYSRNYFELKKSNSSPYIY